MSELKSIFADELKVGEVSNGQPEGQIILTDGTFRDDVGLCWELPSIVEAKTYLSNSRYNLEYIPSIGLQEFRNGVAKLCFGEQLWSLHRDRISSVQTISSTGALRLASQLLLKFLPQDSDHIIYYGTPTWANHDNLFHHAGFKVQHYAYLSDHSKLASREASVSNCLDALRNAERHSVALLQPCGHNPTGRIYSRSEWLEIAIAVEEKGLFVIFDMAYQGFESGSAEEDAWPIRLFAERNIEVMVCVTFSKSMGLYSERAGGLLSFVRAPGICQALTAEASKLIRWEYSNPPAYGARLASLLLNDYDLNRAWASDLKYMYEQLQQKRQTLLKAIEQATPTSNEPSRFANIQTDRGFFSLLDLSTTQVVELREQHGIVLTGNGRINIAGLKSRDIPHIAKAIAEIMGNSCSQC